MRTVVNYQMLMLARESRGLTQKDVSEKLNSNQSMISMTETNFHPVGENLLKQLSKLYKYPESFFYQAGEFVPTLLNYRKRLTVAQKLLLPIEANVNIYRLNIQQLIEKLQLLKPELPVLNSSPQQAAVELRKLWKVPKETIENITELMESKGIIIVSFDFGTERVDSRSILTDDGHPIIFTNKKLLGDRLRFTLAYELGHLIMHIGTDISGERDINHEANEFAAALLLPENDIKPELEDLNLIKLGELKKKWKVSMQALLYRGCDLQTVTENQKRYLINQFNLKKIRRREPPELDIPKEKPKLLTNYLTKFKDSQRFGLPELAGALHLTTDDFIVRYS